MKDGRDLEVSAATPEAIAALDLLRQQWLSYGNRLAEFLPVAEQNLDTPMIVLMTALLNLSMETRQGYADVAPYLARARAMTKQMNARELLWLEAIEGQAADDLARVLKAHDALAQEFPRDIFAAKMGQKHLFYLGDSEGMLRLSDLTIGDNADVSHALGMRAFALEQCRRLDEAEATGRRAVELDRNDPWAHHAVAHVLETQARLDEGVAWMSGLSDAWANCNSFMYTHNWWHLALFHIDRDETELALDLLDKRVWGVWKEFSQDQVNAISLLARLELRGVDVGERWQDLAIYLKPRIHEHVAPFLDLHYIYGLARAGERAAVTEMLASLEAHADQADEVSSRGWAKAGVPAAHGLAAHAQGDWSHAVTGLAEALPHLQAIGGSHAQRDLFEQIYLDALIRAGWNDKAVALLRQRDHHRGGIVFTKRSLADLHGRLGQSEIAAQFATSAAELQRLRAAG
ncbi:MAG: tetratricopeptide repeat protein [Rhodospirillales bacterium]